MKILQNLVLSAFMLTSIIINAQTKTNAPKVNNGTKITLQFEDDNKAYECNTIYYKRDKADAENKADDYDISASCYGTADSKILEWVANPKLLKNIKIIVTKGGKKDREFLLKNANLKTYSEASYKNETAGDIGATYDFTIEVEQITINGIAVKGTK
ncbi:MAG: hypothetical protein RRY99_06040 [Flavobacterium sp.]